VPPVLDGVRVLELAGGIASQYLGQLLADQGADVLTVEPPGGSDWRGRPQFHVWNRGKRSALADVTTEQGHAFVLDLAARADIVITDHGPAHSNELRLTIDDLAAENSRLVHAWLPPYGAEGPLADIPPDDALGEALGGNLAGQTSSTGDPVLVTLPLASYMAAMLASSATCAALIARDRDGTGQQVTVSWLAGSIQIHTAALVTAPGQRSLVGAAARAMVPQGSIAGYKLYKASDDWLFIPCGNNAFYNKFLVALDLAEVLGEERFTNGPWGLAPEDQKELRDRIAPIIAEKPRDFWLRHLDEHDVPAAPVMSREDFIVDEQVVHNGLRLELDDPELGRVAMANTPVEFWDTPGGVRGPAPALGAHTESALADWPERSSPAASSPTLISRPPLDGVRVVDISSYIAGSLCPMVLADYGADVIKVESFDGDAFRAFGAGFLGWNRGKRGLAVNLKHQEQSQEIVYDLVRRADVVVENFRAGVSTRLGVDYDTLRAINPNIIYCSIPGWGETGPYAGKPVFDPIFQARSGAQRAQGGDGDPVFLVAAITDYSAAHLTAYAATAGLFARERTGKGQKVTITLAGATMAIQSGEFIFPASGGSFGHAAWGAKDCIGTSAAYRCYPASDGWLFIACTTEAHWHAMAKAIGRPELAYPGAWPAVAASHPRDGLVDEVISMLGEDTADSWVQRLTSHGVPAAPIVALWDSLDHPQALASGLDARHEHPQFGDVRQTGVMAKFSRTPGIARRAAPTLGQHTDEILREIGYDEARIAVLREKQIVV
jgi:crotonobetainyl-CoA:carnitine CoA-transferase CaiB-like acyl-CoA transferase